MPHKYTTQSPAERLWSRVDKSGECWPWTGGRTKNGYGQLTINYRKYQPHRLAYEVTFGPIPEGLEVCHNCPGGDNPLCCNPAHLWLGTHAENMADKDAKGRTPFGGRAPGARLTEAQAVAILARVQGGERQAALAREYGVSTATICLLVSGKNWAHLHQPSGPAIGPPG